MYKRIVLAYDGSAPGQQALLDCHDIAQWSQSELFLVAVMPASVSPVGLEGYVYDPKADESMRATYQSTLDNGVGRLSASGLTGHGEVLIGDPVDEIARYAGRIHADLIIVGHKHLEGWAARWWRGSISKSLIEHSPCSVLVVITH
jgi:nucleotide-binding universal stress UspA family protein